MCVRCVHCECNFTRRCQTLGRTRDVPIDVREPNETKNSKRILCELLSSVFFQREEAGEAGRAIAGPIVGGKVTESGVERTIDGSGGLQGT